MTTTKKLCSQCKNTFPATSDYFHKDSSSKDKLKYICKECNKENSKKQNQSGYHRNYYEENKEMISEKQKVYYEDNKDHLKEEMRKHYYNNKVAYYKRNEQRKADKKKAGEITSTLQDIRFLFFDKSCCYCQSSDLTKSQEDHIKSRSEFTEETMYQWNDISSTVPACTKCNKSKASKSLDNYISTLPIEEQIRIIKKIISWIQFCKDNNLQNKKADN